MTHYPDPMTFAIAPIDQAFRASEAKWGVDRLPALVSSATLANYRKGWTAYRTAIDDNDHAAVTAIQPKMIHALAVMDREATANGHAPLAVDAWETPLADGHVLAIVRTNPEAHALATSAAGRAMTVYSLAEIARIIDHYHMATAIKREFTGATIRSPVLLAESQVNDAVTGEPIADLLHTEAAA
jgi:hypothetical protein